MSSLLYEIMIITECDCYFSAFVVFMTFLTLSYGTRCAPHL